MSVLASGLAVSCFSCGWPISKVSWAGAAKLTSGLSNDTSPWFSGHKAWTWLTAHVTQIHRARYDLN